MYGRKLLNWPGSVGPLLLLAVGCSSSVPVTHLEVPPPADAERLAGEPTRVSGGSSEPTRVSGGSSEPPPAPFTLPDDVGGKLLDRVLRPRPQPGPLQAPERNPLPTFPPVRASDPATTLLTGQLPSVPRFPAPARRGGIRPEVLSEEGLDLRLTPGVPRPPYFPTDRPVRVETEDSRIPPPLPQLGTPVPDSIPTEDTTAEISTANVLRASLPERTSAVPFVRQGVPDPFENRQTLPAVRVPEESSTPQANPPRGPEK